jgi:hypothetical protein
MNGSDAQLADAWKMPAEVAEVFAEKMQGAKETLNERILKGAERGMARIEMETQQWSA